MLLLQNNDGVSPGREKASGGVEPEAVTGGVFKKNKKTVKNPVRATITSADVTSTLYLT